MLWFNKQGKLVMRDGHLVDCSECPCECEPFVIATKITNRAGGTVTWDLTPYKFSGKYRKGARWRLRDVGEAHYNDPTQPCSGTIYGEGEVKKKGELADLPDSFTTSYSYNGYMTLEQGCLDEETGEMIWTCP